MTNHKLFIVSGPSGAGKSSLFQFIMEQEIISFTTRLKRIGEQHGVDYYFVSKIYVKTLQKENALFECETYKDNYYGTTKEEIGKLKKGPAFVVVEFEGMKKIKKLYPNSVTIFIYTDKESVRNQMAQRGDSEEQIQSRLELFDKEIATRNHYDYVILNRPGRFTETANIIQAIIESETKSS